MNRRLIKVCTFAVTAGLACLFVRAVWPVPAVPAHGERGLLARLSSFRANLLVPHRPPAELPPGLPLTGEAISSSGARPTRAALAAAVQQANVVVVVLDAARVDHLGCYGYPRDTTPNFDRLAREGMLFEQHFCEQPETLPSTLSLLTGQYPDTHGLTGNLAAVPASPPAFTMEGAFAHAGFATSLLSSSPVVAPECGVPADFQQQYLSRRRGPAQPSGAVAALPGQLRQLLRQSPAPDGRFFAYLHIFPPHEPYRAPDRFVAAFRGRRPPRYWQGEPGYRRTRDGAARQEPRSLAEWTNLYDANLRWADSVLGEVVRVLGETGVLEHTLLIVTSDHGEAMREHGQAFHVHCPYDEALHIPLLLRFPGERKPVGRVRALSQTIDVLPTLLDLYQIPHPPGTVQGVSLLPLLTGEARAVNDYVFSRTANHTVCYTVRDARSTLLLWAERDMHLLYDMDADPWQTSNLYEHESPRAVALEKAFADFAQRQRRPPEGFPDLVKTSSAGPRPPRGELTEEQLRALRSLGYVD